MGLKLKMEKVLSNAAPQMLDTIPNAVKVQEDTWATDFLKSKPPSLIEAMEDAQAYMQEERGFLRPSSLGKCDRMGVFYLARAPESQQNKGARIQRVLDVGTATHEVVQKYLADHPEYWFAPESRVSAVVEGVQIKGSCDGIMIRRSDGYRFAIEIKTKKNKLFNELTKPDPEHIRQASIYARLHNVWWIVILYWDKDQQYLKEFAVSYDPVVWEDIKRTIADIKVKADRAMSGGTSWTDIDERQLPVFNEKVCDPDFCPFKKFCESCGGSPSKVKKPFWR